MNKYEVMLVNGTGFVIESDSDLKEFIESQDGWVICDNEVAINARNILSVSLVKE